jgi:hypothetical protein
MLRGNRYITQALLINLLIEGNYAAVLDLLNGLLYFIPYRDNANRGVNQFIFILRR